MTTSLTWIDIAIVIAITGLTAWVGCFFATWIKKPEDFYVAGRQLSPFILASALAATNMCLFNFQSYVSFSYREGISIVWQECTGLMALILAGLLVLPLFRRLRIATIPEFLGRRYGPSLRVLVAILTALRFAMFLGMLLYLSAQVACVVGGFSDSGPVYHFCIFFFGLLTIAYTMAGGAWAVALTDTIQFVLMVGGGLVMLPLIMHTVGYWEGMQQSLSELGRSDALCFVPRDGLWNWKGALGIGLLGIEWACTDQGMLQRVFSARNVKVAAQAMVYGGMMTIPLALIIPMPGVAASIQVANETMPPVLRPDNVLPMWLASGVVPVGILGLILSGLMASQLSTIGGYLSSTATLVSLDVVNLFARSKKVQLSDRHMVMILRSLTILAGVAMIATSYFAKASRSALDLYIDMIAVVDMPFFVVGVLYGLLWKRATPAAALTGYAAGVAVGLLVQLRTMLGSSVESFVDGVYYLYSYVPLLGDGVTAANASKWDTAIIGMVVTGAAVPIVSLFTKQTHPDQLEEIWRSRTVSQEEQTEGTAFHIWPISAGGRLFLCLTLLSVFTFVGGLILGRYPAQVGYGISRIEGQRFEQAALMILPADLPSGVTVESRRALINDLRTLAKNTDPTDDRRKPLADSLVPRMKELMQSYSRVTQSQPEKYGKAYEDEFNEVAKSIQADPNCVIRESRIAGPLAIAAMVCVCVFALLRLRYD